MRLRSTIPAAFTTILCLSFLSCTKNTVGASFPFSLPTHHPRNDCPHLPGPSLTVITGVLIPGAPSPEMLVSAAWNTLAHPTCGNLSPLRSVLRASWPPSSLLLFGRLLFLKCQRLWAQGRKETRSSERRLWPVLTQHTQSGDSRGDRGGEEGSIL